MGYIFALVLGLALVALGLFLFFSRRQRPADGHLSASHPVSRNNPAADEPTPAASSTAGTGAKNRAQERVPPA